MVRAIMIIEIAGRPAEHVREILEKHVGGLKSYKDVTIESMTFSEPRLIEKVDKEGKPTGEMTDMFTCFSEIEFETQSLLKVGEIVFDFMPSSVEIVEPSRVSMDCVEATALLNNISGRLHRYDEIARVAQFKIHELSQQLKNNQMINPPISLRTDKKEDKKENSKEVKKNKKK